MACLVSHSRGFSLADHKFGQEATIGTAEDNSLRVPPGLSVAPHHAAILRSAIYNVHVLVDLGTRDTDTRVNGRRVVVLRALRHRDRIELGSVSMEFLEVVASVVGQ